MALLSQSKAVKTNSLSKTEAEEWLVYLLHQTNKEVRKRYSWHVAKGYWPMKAVQKGKAEKNPKFIVNHHTGGSKTNPVIYRFLQSKKASSQAVIERNGNILALASHEDACYHAVPRGNSPLAPLPIRRLLNIERGWLNEYGIETIGNGNKWLFTAAQFKSLIVLQRLLVAFYPSIESIKSHREFSPTSRSGDPGPLYFLPLVEHAIFNDVDLDDDSYWLREYEKNPIEFANQIKDWFNFYEVSNRDEWKRHRRREITRRNILEIK